MIGINNLPSTIKQLSQSTIECKTTDSEVSPPTDCSEGPTLRVLIAVKMMAGGPLFPPSNKLQSTFPSKRAWKGSAPVRRKGSHAAACPLKDDWSENLYRGKANHVEPQTSDLIKQLQQNLFCLIYPFSLSNLAVECFQISDKDASLISKRPQEKIFYLFYLYTFILVYLRSSEFPTRINL